MTTLFDLTYNVASLLGNLKEGRATGGSTTTLIDTAGLAGYDIDYFNEGSAWIVKTDNGLAPQGEYSVVSDFVQSTRIATLRDALTATIEAGDRYAISNDRFSIYQIIQQINIALLDLGLIPSTDATLAVVLNQRTYSLPAVAQTIDLREVWYQPDTTADIWERVLNWRMEYTTGGTPEKLILAYDLPAGSPLKLVYASQHPEMRLYNDKLNEVVHQSRIVFEAAASCLQDYMDKTRLKDYQPRYNRLIDRANFARINHPLPPLPPTQGMVALIDLDGRGA